MTQFSVKPNAYIYLTILLLFLPIRWITAWVIAILFHEICHWIAVKTCGGEIIHISIGLGGAQMQCNNLPEKCRFFAILCGPLGGLALSCLGKWFPRLALCSFFLSIYNLLPISPLDGGLALRILLKSDSVFFISQRIFLLLLLSLALYAAFCLRLGIYPIIIVLGIFLKNRNCPCKESVCRVQ